MGWYADVDRDARSDCPWQVVLGETGSGSVIASLPVWFRTEQEAVDFIDRTIIPNAGHREVD
jgi:hypothetical protein